jgi:hypothetical protein
MAISNNQSFGPSQAEGGKFVKLSPSTFPTLSSQFPQGQYALLTYLVNGGTENGGTENGDTDSATPQVVSFDVQGQKDAFGKLRVSTPYTIFDSKLISDKANLFFDEEINGGGSINHNFGDSSVILSVSADGDYVIRQTKMRFNYQAGKAQNILLTGVLGGTALSGTESKIGYFNSSTSTPFSASLDGIWFERIGSEYNLCISKLGVTNRIPRSQWNVDTLDGNGPSGVTVDFSKSQIFNISFEWLGVGSVIFGLIVNEKYYVLHVQRHANIIDGTYMLFCTK